MKKLLEAINRGILKGLTERNSINILTDLDDSEIDQLDSIQAKSVNNKMHALYRFFPKTKEELVEIIKAEVKRKGWNCSLNHIDVSQITDMSNLFSDNAGYGLTAFNGDISRWDVSNVTNMSRMFYRAYEFNQPIGDWDVSNVKNMYCMFASAESFNQPIGDWDVSNVTSMNGMFCWTDSFNQPICDWDVSNVTNMEDMFYRAKSFNQDLSNWQIKTNCNTANIFVDCPIKEEYKPNGIE